jgi:hypothetical protein
VTVGIIIYVLPPLLFGLCGVGAIIATWVAGGDATFMVFPAFVLCSCLGIILLVALRLLAPALTIQYAKTGEFTSMFRLGQVVAITRENLANVILVEILVTFATMAVGFLSLIPVIGWFIIRPAGTAWISFATGHLYGQIGRNLPAK